MTVIQQYLSDLERDVVAAGRAAMAALPLLGHSKEWRDAATLGSIIVDLRRLYDQVHEFTSELAARKRPKPTPPSAGPGGKGRPERKPA